VFSPSPTKVVTAAEGGVICTGDPSLAARLRSMRDYGKHPADGEDMVYLGLSLPQVFQVENGTWRNLTSAELGISYYHGCSSRQTARSSVRDRTRRPVILIRRKPVRGA
jgi:hypothetical protein